MMRAMTGAASATNPIGGEKTVQLEVNCFHCSPLQPMNRGLIIANVAANSTLSYSASFCHQVTAIFKVNLRRARGCADLAFTTWSCVAGPEAFGGSSSHCSGESGDLSMAGCGGWLYFLIAGASGSAFGVERGALGIAGADGYARLRA